MTSFFHFTLRTSDVLAARAFYAAVLGRDHAEIFPLHEQAVARGARPHWLGYLAVPELDSAVAAFVARGAAPLGPKWVNADGIETAVVRDAGGAIVALAKPGQGTPAHPDVAWHVLNTHDEPTARASYGELLDFHFQPSVDFGSVGRFSPFAWQAGGPAVGALSDIAERPGVHPHWLFFFRVPALGPALDAVRERGGVIAGSFTTPEGNRTAVCDDPQGAAFGLFAPT